MILLSSLVCIALYRSRHNEAFSLSALWSLGLELKQGGNSPPCLVMQS
jgi:hypothetical protein